jgi:hypothetical protein
MTIWNLPKLKEDMNAFFHFMFAIVGYFALLMVIYVGGTFSETAILDANHQNLLKISFIPIIYIVLYVTLASRNQMDHKDSGDLLSVVDFTILAAFTHQCVIADNNMKDFCTFLYFFPWYFIFDEFFRLKNGRVTKRFSKVAFSLFAMGATLSLEQRSWTTSWLELYRFDAQMFGYWITLLGAVSLAWFFTFMTHSMRPNPS